MKGTGYRNYLYWPQLIKQHMDQQWYNYKGNGCNEHRC